MLFLLCTTFQRRLQTTQHRYHHRQREHGSDEHILIYVTNGSGEVSVGEYHHLLLKNDGIIILKDTPHQYGTNDTDTWTIYWVHFDGTKAQFLVNRFGTKFSLQTHHSEREDVRISLFKDLIHTLSMGYTQSNLEYASLSFQQLLTPVRKRFSYFLHPASTPKTSPRGALRHF